MLNILSAIFMVLSLHLNGGATKKPQKINKKEVRSGIEKAIEWHINKPFVGKQRWNENKRYNWAESTFHTGLLHYYKYTKKSEYLEWVMGIGESCNWQPRARPYDANEYCMVQAYCEIYEHTGDRSHIDKSLFFMEMPLLRYLEPDVRMEGNKYWQDWWSWCDALYMAPPAFARMGKLVKEPRFYDYMDRMWWITSDHLYSREDSLYYRDDTFFPEKRLSEYGNRVFWSRGNGWVIAGLCRVLDYLPADYGTRFRYEKQFKEMAYRLLDLQTDDGFWPMSLLEAEHYPGKEASGTAFFCYAFLWGINNGLLPEEDFKEPATKAWEMLQTCLHPSGKLGYVQQVGHQPGTADFDDEQAYGVGAYVLAGTELLKYLDKKKIARSH